MRIPSLEDGGRTLPVTSSTRVPDIYLQGRAMSLPLAAPGSPGDDVDGALDEATFGDAPASSSMTATIPSRASIERPESSSRGRMRLAAAATVANTFGRTLGSLPTTASSSVRAVAAGVAMSTATLRHQAAAKFSRSTSTAAYAGTGLLVSRLRAAAATQPIRAESDGAALAVRKSVLQRLRVLEAAQQRRESAALRAGAGIVAFASAALPAVATLAAAHYDAAALCVLCAVRFGWSTLSSPASGRNACARSVCVLLLFATAGAWLPSDPPSQPLAGGADAVTAAWDGSLRILRDIGLDVGALHRNLEGSVTTSSRWQPDAAASLPALRQTPCTPPAAEGAPNGCFGPATAAQAAAAGGSTSANMGDAAPAPAETVADAVSPTAATQSAFSKETAFAVDVEPDATALSAAEEMLRDPVARGQAAAQAATGMVLRGAVAACGRVLIVAAASPVRSTAVLLSSFGWLVVLVFFGRFLRIYSVALCARPCPFIPAHAPVPRPIAPLLARC